MYTYSEIFKNFESIKDSHSKSRELEKLLMIKPNYDYLEKIIILSQHRTKDIKWAALTLLRNFKSFYLEDILLDIIEKGKDNLTITLAFEALSLNGSDKSIPVLIKLFKKSRDSNLRPRLLNTLRQIYFQQKLSEESKKSIYSLIGNKYPFFYGFWYDIKKAHKTDINNWQKIAHKQLENKKLNIIFELNNEIDIHITLKFIIAIFKNPQYFNSEISISEEFYPMINTFYNSGSLYGKSIEELISLISKNIKELENQMSLLKSFEKIPFAEYFKNRNDIFNSLWCTTDEFAISQMLWKNSFLFAKNEDKQKYIEYILQLISKRQYEPNYRTIEYLNSIKNYG